MLAVNRSAIGPVVVGAVSDAWGGAGENPAGLRSTLLLFSLVPLLHALAVYLGRTAVAAEQEQVHAQEQELAASKDGYHSMPRSCEDAGGSCVAGGSEVGSPAAAAGRHDDTVGAVCTVDAAGAAGAAAVAGYGGEGLDGLEAGNAVTDSDGSAAEKAGE